jgi:uncharacterized protein (TIGR03083 family)
MVAISVSPAVSEVTGIPYVNAEEAYRLLSTELERFLRLVEKLKPEDWSKPTACTAWNVRDMLAHQAGGYASGASLMEMIHQLSSMPGPGQLPEDAINEIQLRDRINKTPAELIAELKKVGPVAAQKWAFGHQLLKLVSIPHAVAGKLSLRHLMWVTHSRDTWMHRLDICRATGQAFEQTAEHDGRIAALVMRDVAEAMERNFKGPALVFELSGIAGGTWKIGRGEPVATIRMDVLDFNIFASGRYSYEQARPLATITGDVATAEKALKTILVVY